MHSEVFILDRNLDRLRWVDQIHKGRIMTLASNVGTVARAVMVTIRSSVVCDGVCIYLPPAKGGELQVYTLDFPGDADFQKSGVTLTFDKQIYISSYIFVTELLL